MQLVTTFPLWGVARSSLCSFLPSMTLDVPSQSSLTIYDFLSFSPTLTNSQPLLQPAPPPLQAHNTLNPIYNMETTSQDTATLDELNRSIKDIHVAVERALSLHIPPNQIKSIVAIAIREGMKTDLGEAVKRAMAGHVSPEEVRAVVDDTIRENRKPYSSKRFSMEPWRNCAVPFANFIVHRAIRLGVMEMEASLVAGEPEMSRPLAQGMKSQSYQETSLSHMLTS